MELRRSPRASPARDLREVDVGEVAGRRDDQVGRPPGRRRRRCAAGVGSTCRPAPARGRASTTPSVVLLARAPRRAIRAARPGDRSTSVANALSGPQLSTSSVARERHGSPAASAPHELLEREAVALRERRALALPVVGQQHQVVAPRRTLARPRDGAHLAVDLDELLHRLRALRAGVVGDLVVAQVVGVDDGRAAVHLADHEVREHVAHDRRRGARGAPGRACRARSGAPRRAAAGRAPGTTRGRPSTRTG